MRLVITNDDGFGAPGIERLARACRSLGHEVTIVAPHEEQSGVGHAVTTPDEIRIEEVADGAYKAHGSPADCARVALRHLVPDADWLVAGINRGANLGTDTFISGTVAAAREAAILGVPALAISQYVARFRDVDWEACERRALPVLERMLARAPGEGRLWNLNLPHPVDEGASCRLVECPVDPSPSDVRFERRGDALHWRGNYHERPRRPDHDIDVCFRGQVAVSRLGLFPIDEA